MAITADGRYISRCQEVLHNWQRMLAALKPKSLCLSVPPSPTTIRFQQATLLCLFGFSNGTLQVKAHKFRRLFFGWFLYTSTWSVVLRWCPRSFPVDPVPLIILPSTHANILVPSTSGYHHSIVVCATGVLF